jgi:uncharacterized protein (UPF0210 family)
MGELVANEASRRLDVPFGIVDLSLAPTPAVGDSVAEILEEIGLEQVGTHGTIAANHQKSMDCSFQPAHCRNQLNGIVYVLFYS